MPEKTIDDVLKAIKENRDAVEAHKNEMPGLITKQLEPAMTRLGTIEKGQQTIEQRITAVENRRPQVDISELDLSDMLVQGDERRNRLLGMTRQVLRGWNTDKRRCFLSIVRSEVLGKPMSKDMRTIADQIVGRALSPDSASGSYLEFDQFSRDIIRLVNEFAVVTSLFRFFPMTTDSLKLVVRSTGATVTKKSPNTALDSFDVAFTQVSVNLSKIGGYTLLPVELMEDEQMNPSLADFIAMEVSLAIAQKVDTNGLKGDGTSTYDDITGLINFTGCKEVVLPNGKTTGDAVTTLAVRACAPKLFVPARANAMWVGHESVLARLEELNKGDLAAPLVTDRNGKPFVARRPWISAEAMPDIDSIGANTVIAVLGDYRFALLAARGGLSLSNGTQELAVKLRTSQEVKFLEDQVAIKGTVRIDIKKLDGAAFCLLKTAAAA